MNEAELSLLEFPCRFPIKAMGADKDDFQQLVFRLIQRHVPELSAADIKARSSRNGRYVAVTITIQATSKAQLDAIYQDLSENKQVVMAL